MIAANGVASTFGAPVNNHAIFSGVFAMSDANLGHASEGAGRLFRAYEQQCIAPTHDTLFSVLAAMHSLNDRLAKTVGRDFHDFQEFIALKALRNLTHHAEEVRANVALVPAPGLSELAFLCVLRRDQVERAIEGTALKWRDQTRAACENKFHWYGPAVNINPCVYNFMVHAYEMLERDGIQIPEDAIAGFEEAYVTENELGRDHFVDGRITAKTSELEKILAGVVANMPSA